MYQVTFRVFKSDWKISQIYRALHRKYARPHSTPFMIYNTRKKQVCCSQHTLAGRHPRQHFTRLLNPERIVDDKDRALSELGAKVDIH